MAFGSSPLRMVFIRLCIQDAASFDRLCGIWRVLESLADLAAINIAVPKDRPKLSDVDKSEYDF